ncbi:MAG TPA: Type 1 glutamine amidotransferase-like domain-containing protein [Actinomycetota bacterium]|nr:Type 1 glutamine amidotransferase-like domain-containing protein [Actinomycetota bacterium]
MSSGPVSLMGGMEHSPGCEPIDRHLMDLLGVRRPTVVVVPAASRSHMVPVASERALRYWSRLGGRVRVALAGRDDPEYVVDALEGADIIVMTGGQSDHIRTALHGTEVWDRIVAMWMQGTAVAGSSMGMIELFELRFRLWPPRPLAVVRGLGLLNGYLGVPHYDRYGLRRWCDLASLRLTGPGILGIDERTGLVGREGRFRVVGCGSAAVVRNGARWELAAGAEIVLNQSENLLRPVGEPATPPLRQANRLTASRP